MTKRIGEPMGHRADKSNIEGLYNWEQQMQFVKCEWNPFINIKKTLLRNRYSGFTNAERHNSINDIVYDANDLFHGIEKNRLLDHWDLYTTKNGRKYITLSPYLEPWHNDYADVILHVINWCNQNEIDLEIKTHGFYYPPATMFILSHNPFVHDPNTEFNKHYKHMSSRPFCKW